MFSTVLVRHEKASAICREQWAVLGPQQDQVQHMRALPHGEVGAAIKAMWGSGATPVNGKRKLYTSGN